MADVTSFVEKTLKLLNIEREAEINETRAYCENKDLGTLQEKGVCLAKLLLFGRKTGLYGRSLLTFGKRQSGRKDAESVLPAHCITSGDIVGLSYSSVDNNISELSSGIITKVTSQLITVAFDESLDSQIIDDNAMFRLTRLANDITHRRMKRALESISTISSLPCTHLVDVLFGSIPQGEPLCLSSINNIEYFNKNLNESQKRAVKFALTCKEVGIIHGPAGTGKTTTVVELIMQAVNHAHCKVLACAPSNIAVDNIVEKLAEYKMKIIRLGHPARVLRTIQRYSLDAIIDSSDGTAIVKDVRNDIDKTQSKLKSSHDRGERNRLRSEIKSLRRELREREDKVLKEILQKADVILSTNVSAAAQDGALKHLAKDHFDLVVIDEVAQSLEASCWIPLLSAPRCVLAGDHKQLPPTILSRDAAKQGLEYTLMERVIDLLGDDVVHMLTTQYRMNEIIMQWSSDELYNSRLKADVSVAHHLLHGLSGVQNTELTSLPLLLIDTAGCDFYELDTPDEDSKGNENEAELVTHHIETLVTSGVKPCDIGVITPYNLQVELLRSRLSNKFPALEIKSVDGFQGREKEAIVISMVRSNNKGEIGFLAENRRTNVAVTRARRHLTIVADSSTVCGDPFLKTLIDYINSHGEVWSAEEYRHHLAGDSMISMVKTTKVKKVDKKEVKKKEKKGNKEANKNKSEPAHTSKTNQGHNRTVVDNRGCEDTFVVDKDREEKQKKYEAMITKFINDKTKHEMTFPSTLTSQERFIVHSIAEEQGLSHVSKGTGDERFIALSKQTSQVDSGERNCSNEVVVTDSEKDGMKSCSNCGKLVTIPNSTLHELRCGQITKQSKSVTPKNIKQKPKKKDSKSSCEITAVKNSDGDNFDDLLAEFVRNDSTCAFASCDKSILTVGQTCRCCSQCYCLTHHIPEIHGCAQVAKDRARHDVRTPQPRQQTRKTAIKNAQLHRKLENKLKTLEGQRKTKQKADK